MANTTDTKLKSAEDAAKARFRLGQREKWDLLDRVARTVIRDKLVAPQAMIFSAEGDWTVSELRVRYGEGEMVRVHQHALGQLASKVEFPMVFANRLRLSRERARVELLAHNLNVLFCNTNFSGESHRFLHRIVGDELRGFLSRRYNRHLASLPMLNAFVEAYDLAGAQPTESSATDVRVCLKAFLPHVFEAYPGQFICVGVEWSNSDFGAGRLAITQTIWDPLRGTRAVMDEPISKIHVGSIIEDSDLVMSEDTMAKEVDTQASAINDAVKQYLSEEQIDRMLRAVKAAHEEEIPLSALKGLWRKILLKSEIDSLETLLDATVEDLPPPGVGLNGQRLPTRWWASSVLSRFADRTGDDDRKSELQRAAGRVLAPNKE